MSKMIMLAVVIIPYVVHGSEKCVPNNDLGKELIQRIYAAESYIHMDSPFTDDLKKLNFNKDGLDVCDIKNWDIEIKLGSKDAFLATVTSKLTKKSYTIDEKKHVSEH